MAEFRASIRGQRTTPDFTYDTLDRAHDVRFGSGIDVPAAGAGSVSRTNPEELFVGALSSCHMLTFLAIAAKKKMIVESYEDDAEGWLDKNDEGRIFVARVVLRPRVRFAGEVTREQLDKLHASAHKNCFIALSAKSDVSVEPVLP